MHVQMWLAGKCQPYYHTFTSVETPKKFVFAPRPGSHLLFTLITVNTDLAAIVLTISFNPLTFGNSLLASAVLRKEAIKLNPLMRGWVRACSECVNTCWLFPWELSRGTERRATLLEFSLRTEQVTSIQLSAILSLSLLCVTNRPPEQTPTVSTVQGLWLSERDFNPQGSFYLCLNPWRVSSWLSYINT